VDIGRQLNGSLAEQPKLNNKDLDNRNPQDHPKPGQRPQGLSGGNAKDGSQNHNWNQDSHEMREDQRIDTTGRRNPQARQKEDQTEGLMDIDNPGQQSKTPGF
jgi:hypothetical protein